MTSPGFTTKSETKAPRDQRICPAPEFLNFGRRLILKMLLLLIAHGFLLAAFSTASAQKIAVIVPEKTEIGEKYADHFRQALTGKFNVLDNSLGESAFNSAAAAKNPFNLTTTEAQIVGAAIGCDYFLMVKSGVQRRSSFGREEFYEAFAFIYVVSARTGRLVIWKPQIHEADTPPKAEKLLLDSADNSGAEIFKNLKIIRQQEASAKSPDKIEEVPNENLPEAENFRPPLPFKRIKPEYSRTAYIYDVKATIDALVDVDENGAISRIEIVRWAGFGLDESVIETVRKMNWRPAMRNGKALPMRVLLRYNFKKIEKEED